MPCSAKRSAAIALILMFACTPVGLAQSKNSLGVSLYNSMKNDTRALFDKTIADFDLQKDRRVRAGVAAATPAAYKRAIAGIKMIIYNKAAIVGICADQTDRDPSSEEASSAVSRCIEDHQREMTKTTKLSDYGQVFGAEKMLKCDLQARDFENEARYPPFDFLIRDDVVPHLVNFRKMNECLQKGL